MTSDVPLFGEDDSGEMPVASSDPRPDLVPGWQVEQLRAAFDRRGIDSMEERRALVTRVAGREVESLRDLTSREARVIAEALVDRVADPGTSSWDDREDDTWIDRL